MKNVSIETMNLEAENIKAMAAKKSYGTLTQ